MKRIKQFFVALILFVIFDFIWLGFVMKDFNMRQLAEIGRIENGVYQLDYVGATVAYVLMALAIVFYVLPLSSQQSSFKKSFQDGALLGLIIYGVFDMTNLAILKNYPVAFVIPDMLWGSFVFGLVAVVASKIFLKPSR